MRQDTKFEYFCSCFILLPFFHSEIFAFLRADYECVAHGEPADYTQTGNSYRWLIAFRLHANPFLSRAKKPREPSDSFNLAIYFVTLRRHVGNSNELFFFLVVINIAYRSLNTYVTR